MNKVDILIPTYNRFPALAVTLTSLAFQYYHDLRIVISDQSDHGNVQDSIEVQAVINVLNTHGIQVEVHRHLPRRGMAEQRQFLLNRAQAPFVLYLDDDLILEPFVVINLLQAIQEEGCGFIGNAVIGLSFIGDIRPDEQKIEFWDGPVLPEVVHHGTEKWARYRLHNAANLYHVQNRLGLDASTPRKYKVAWVGGCVLYDAAKLRAAGGFTFWSELPREHCGEDVYAQLRVMERFGGCGLIPSGVYHQELPTTVQNREVNAPEVLCPEPDLLRI
jgi:glycosyltransferase involved in cell wall biosynthesis